MSAHTCGSVDVTKTSFSRWSNCIFFW